MARYGLLGERLGHSFSPYIHRALGGYDYELIEVSREELGPFLRARDFSALNVTIPYKQAVMPYLDSISDTAERIGSVNTIVQDANGGLHGYNTDAYGFIQLTRHAGIDVRGRNCLVLGSGGASKTVCACLRKLDAAEITVISRSGPDNYQNLSRHADARIIVNATPVGMYPHNGQSPVNLAQFPQLEGVLDLIYNPARTELLLQAEARGIPFGNGLHMLVAQAKQAVELFLNVHLNEEAVSPVAARLARDTANIVLIGMPGSGKTTVGTLLAQTMGRRLIDTDTEIEKRAGMTCGDCLRRHGEGDFRALEALVIAEAGKETGVIIATGGGAVTRPENRNALRQNGMLFHLDRPLEKLARTGDRPLSATDGRRAELFARRAPLAGRCCLP